MNWISTIFLLVLVNDLLGYMIYRIWKLFHQYYEQKKDYLAVYQTLKTAIVSMLIPFSILALLNDGIYRDLLYGPRMFYRSGMSVPFWIWFGAACVWIAGVLCCGIRRLWSQHRILQGIRRQNRELDDQEIAEFYTVTSLRRENFGKIWIYENDMIGAPMIFGIRRRTILLPKQFYKQKNYEIVLEHEIIHAKQKDILFKRISVWLSILFWFSPWAGQLAADVNEWSETACDLKMCALPDSRWKKREYFECLITYESEEKHMFQMFCAFSDSHRLIYRRIQRAKHYCHLPKRAKRSAQRMAALLMLIGLILPAAAGTAANAAYTQRVIRTDYQLSEGVFQHSRVFSHSMLVTSGHRGCGYPVYLTEGQTLQIYLSWKAMQQMAGVSTDGYLVGGDTDDRMPLDRANNYLTISQSGWYHVEIDERSNNKIVSIVMTY